jgi:SprT-like family
VIASYDAIPDPTGDQLRAYRAAFDYFNERLFDGELSRCLLNFSRKSKRTRGFFAPNRWERGDGRTHEISLNPDFLKREPRSVMSTLVHEMIHLWQEEFGTPSRTGYHIREWAGKMESLGLMPSHTGLPGGKRTGQTVSQSLHHSRRAV